MIRRRDINLVPRDETQNRNILIYIDEDAITVEALTLYKASPYFSSLLSGGFKESSQPDVDLTGSFRSTDELVNLLAYINDGDVDLTDDTLEDVLHDATFLLIDSLRTRCEEFLFINLRLENCLRYLALAMLYDLTSVGTLAQDIVRSRFHDSIRYQDEILAVPFDFLQMLIQQGVMRFCELESRREIITRWVMHSPIEREYFYLDLVQEAGLSMMYEISVVFPYRLVLPHINAPLITHSEGLEDKRMGQTFKNTLSDTPFVIPKTFGERAVLLVTQNERCVVFDDESERWCTLPNRFFSDIRFSGSLTTDVVIHVEKSGNIIVENIAKQKLFRITKSNNASFVPTTYFCHNGHLYGIGRDVTKTSENWVNKIFDPVYGLRMLCVLKRFDLKVGAWVTRGTIPGAPALCTITHTIDRGNDIVYMLATRLTSAYQTNGPSLTFHRFDLRTHTGKQLSSPELVDMKNTHLLLSEDSVFLVDLMRHTIQQYNSECDSWEFFAYLPQITKESTRRENCELYEDITRETEGQRQVVTSGDKIYALFSSHPLVNSFYTIILGECHWTELPPPPLNMHLASHLTTLRFECDFISDMSLARFQ